MVMSEEFSQMLMVFVSLYTVVLGFVFHQFWESEEKTQLKYMFHAIHVNPIISGGGVQLKKNTEKGITWH